MKERPIIFSGDMVHAILENRKSQTRRVIKPQPDFIKGFGWQWKGKMLNKAFPLKNKPLQTIYTHIAEELETLCPYGKVGDRLWVGETFIAFGDDHDTILYKADDIEIKEKWQSPIFMPHWASRITLEITDIRVERLQEISKKDILREGVAIMAVGYKDNRKLPRTILFQNLWNSLAKIKWEDNPWVWVIEFKRIGC